MDKPLTTRYANPSITMLRAITSISHSARHQENHTSTSSVEGAISMDMECKGTNFLNAQLLIDTGALIPSDIAISEQFFITNLGGT